MRTFTMMLCLPMPLLAFPTLGAEPAQVYRGATVLTVAQGEIADADFVVQDGKFLAVGKRGEVAIPDGSVIHHLDGKVVIPGLVDTHSHIGIFPRPAVEAHADGNEMTGPVQAGIRAVDAIWPEDPGIRMALAGGVTTANIMPGSGNVIGGQTLYVKLRPGPITNMMVQPGTPEGGLKMANGENPKRSYSTKNQAPGTRMRLAALQREQFVKALDYRRKWRSYRQAQEKARAEAAQAKEAKEPVEPERDLALESLVEVLDRKRTVHFHSHRADDIMTVVRLAEEFGFEVVVQHGTEAYKVVDELARRKIPVSMTIVDSPGGKPEVERPDRARGRDPGEGRGPDRDQHRRLHYRVAVLAEDREPGGARWAVGSRRGEGPDAQSRRDAAPGEHASARSSPARMPTSSCCPGDRSASIPRSCRLISRVENVTIAPRGVRGTTRSAASPCADPSLRPRPAPAATPADQVPAAPGRWRIGTPSRRQEPCGPGWFAPHDQGTADPERPRPGGGWEDPLRRQSRGHEAACGHADSLGLGRHAGLDRCSYGRGRLGPAQRPDRPGPGRTERSEPGRCPHPRQLQPGRAAPGIRHATRGDGHPGLPGPANVIGGQAGIFRTHGRTVEAMTVRFPSAVVFQLGEVPKTTYPGKAPGTRMGTAALIRNALVAASNDRKKRQAAKADSPPDRNLKNEALALLLDRKVPAIFAAHRADDLVTALRLKDEFNLEGQLSLATEAYLIADTLAAAKLPVLVHPTMQRPSSPETFHTTLNNAGLLADRGIPVAITSGYESYVPKTRVLRSEAAIAMVNGLGYDRTLRAITLDAARILKIDAEYGSLEPGKVADLVLYDGDPFEYATHVTYVVLGGRVTYDQTAEAKSLPLRSNIGGAARASRRVVEVFSPNSFTNSEFRPSSDRACLKSALILTSRR